jgi:hypothetical protein
LTILAFPVVPEPFRTDTLATRPLVPPERLSAETLASAPRPVEPEPFSTDTFATRPLVPPDRFSAETLASAPRPVEPEPFSTDTLAARPLVPPDRLSAETLASAPRPVEPEPFSTETLAARPLVPAEPFFTETLTSAPGPPGPVRFRTDTFATRPLLAPERLSAETLAMERPVESEPFPMETLAYRPLLPPDALNAETLAADPRELPAGDADDELPFLASPRPSMPFALRFPAVIPPLPALGAVMALGEPEWVVRVTFTPTIVPRTPEPLGFITDTFATRPLLEPERLSAVTFAMERPVVSEPFPIETFPTRPLVPPELLNAETLTAGPRASAGVAGMTIAAPAIRMNFFIVVLLFTDRARKEPFVTENDGAPGFHPNRSK